MKSSIWPFSSQERLEECREELQLLEAREEALIRKGEWKEFDCDHAGIQVAARCPYCNGTGKIKRFVREYLPIHQQERLQDLRRLFQIRGHV